MAPKHFNKKDVHCGKSLIPTILICFFYVVICNLINVLLRLDLTCHYDALLRILLNYKSRCDF